MKKNLLLIIIALSITACQADNYSITDKWPMEIRLIGNIETQQAGITTQTIVTTPMLTGKTIYTWGKNGTETVFRAWKLTSGANGLLNNDYGYQQYFPADADQLSLYAICGNFETPPSDFDNPFDTSTEPETFIHNVGEDQTTYNGDNSDILNSDLLYAAQSITREDQTITFKHMLSKIEVILKAGKGVTTEELNNEHTRISLMNTRLKVSVIPGEKYPLAIDTDDANNPLTAISIDTKTTTDFESEKNTYAQAIIVPQTIGTSTDKVPFISIFLGSNGATIDYKTHQKFKSGCKYTYHITVNEDRLEGVLTTNSDADNVWSAGNATEVDSTQ